MNRTKTTVFLLAGLGLITSLVSGCSEKAATMTEKEKNEFKGGPMPEEARRKMHERMKAAQANAKAPAGPQ